VNWGRFRTTGTEQIVFSTNGHPSFSPDAFFVILDILKRNHGFIVSEWEVIRIEVNAEDHRLRFEGCLTLELIAGVLLKVYDGHGRGTRFEIVDTRRVPLSEVVRFVREVANQMDGRRALREIEGIRQDFKALAVDTRLALSVARKTRDIIDEMKGQGKNPAQRGGNCVESVGTRRPPHRRPHEEDRR
jgi:hypothetical protein